MQLAKANKRADKAERKAAALFDDKILAERRQKLAQKELKEIKDKMKILRQEFRLLGKRPITDELTADTEVEEAVAR